MKCNRSALNTTDQFPPSDWPNTVNTTTPNNKSRTQYNLCIHPGRLSVDSRTTPNWNKLCGRMLNAVRWPRVVPSTFISDLELVVKWVDHEVPDWWGMVRSRLRVTSNKRLPHFSLRANIGNYICRQNAIARTLSINYIMFGNSLNSPPLSCSLRAPYLPIHIESIL